MVRSVKKNEENFSLTKIKAKKIEIVKNVNI